MTKTFEFFANNKLAATLAAGALALGAYGVNFSGYNKVHEYSQAVYDGGDYDNGEYIVGAGLNTFQCVGTNNDTLVRKDAVPLDDLPNGESLTTTVKDMGRVPACENDGGLTESDGPFWRTPDNHYGLVGSVVEAIF